MLIVRRKQPAACRLAFGAAPFTVVVELPDHAGRTLARLPSVELLLDLILDYLALFLHDQDFFQALGEAPGTLRLERPRHAHLVDPQADVAGHGLVDAEIGERLHDIAVRLARGH